MRTPTLLILGAGASVPYGLPTGAELTEKVAKELLGLPPLSNAYLERDSNQLALLSTRVAYSGTPTIDRYIAEQEHDRDKSDLKRGMCRALVRAESAAITRHTKTDGDWIAWVFHTRLATTPTTFQENRLDVVTFNYDRVPELLFAQMMASTYNKCVCDCYDIVQCDSIPHGDNDPRRPRFNHIMGSLQHPPTPSGHRWGEHRISTKPGAFDSVHQWISVISDPPQNRQPIDYSRYQRIIFLGCGYHVENMERIGLGGDSVRRIADQGTFIGGTAFGVVGAARDRLINRFGPKFVLGEPNQDCLSYLQRHLASDEDFELERRAGSS